MSEFNEMKIHTIMKKNKWSWYKFPKVMQLYMYLLQAAITENEPYGDIMLCRGDVILSLKTISAGCGLGITAIRTALRNLMSTHDVECIPYGHNRIIHINGYDVFMGEAEEPEEKQEDDKKEKRSSQGADTNLKTGENEAENKMTTAVNDADKIAATLRNEHDTMGGYRGAYYSGVTKVCENTESLVTLSNPEKETESKTIYNTHPVNTHSVNPDRSLQSYRAPVVTPSGVSVHEPSGSSVAERAGHSACGSAGSGRSGKFSGEPSGEPSRTSGLFEKFWEAYPRHVNRYLAKQAFERLNPDVDTLSAILKALSRQKESQAWHVEKGRYIPYPARWLSEHRWEDDPAESEREFKTGKEYAPKYTVPAQNYEQRDYSEEMETPEEMLARLQRGCGFRDEAC